MADTPPELTPAELARYSRHLMLPGVGVEGQRKLAAARVLVVGAGGLGSPAALYLAAAGVGTLGLADFDLVEEHNLQRQLLHDTHSVGTPKVESAARRLHALNSSVGIETHPDGVTPANALDLFSRYDLIVDGSDNFPTRYLNTDAACLARKPLVFGSIFRFEGQLAVFDPARGGPCYRCLHPEPPPAGSLPNCGEAGVFGALCGVIGSMQAMESIKLIVGVGEPLRGRLLTYDALNQQWGSFVLARNPDCPLCGSHSVIRSLEPSRYPLPGSAPESASTEKVDYPLEISVEETQQLLHSPQPPLLIDVREPYELKICQIDGARHIPMRQIPESLGDLPKDRPMLILCHHGARSLRVTEYLRNQGFTAVTNVRGGVEDWAEKVDPTMARY